MTTLWILWYGRFGKLMADTFARHWSDMQIRVYSRSKPIDGATFFDLETVAKCDLIMPCGPIGAYREAMELIKPLIRPDAIVIDVCSVKVYPGKWTEEVLGVAQPYISTHPMFGPDSTQMGETFQGLNMMAHNMSADPDFYAQYLKFWRDLGVNIVEMTPAQHDRYAAYSINYTHLLGRVGQLVGIAETPIDTKGFVVIRDVMQYVINDTWDLFWDMQCYNPYATEMIEKTQAALTEIEEKLKKLV